MGLTYFAMRSPLASLSERDEGIHQRPNGRTLAIAPEGALGVTGPVGSLARVASVHIGFGVVAANEAHRLTGIEGAAPSLLDAAAV